MGSLTATGAAISTQVPSGMQTYSTGFLTMGALTAAAIATQKPPGMQTYSTSFLILFL